MAKVGINYAWVICIFHNYSSSHKNNSLINYPINSNNIKF